MLLNVEISNTIWTLVCVYVLNSRGSRNSFFNKDKWQNSRVWYRYSNSRGYINEILKILDRKTSRSNKYNQTVSSLFNWIKSNKLFKTVDKVIFTTAPIKELKRKTKQKIPQCRNNSNIKYQKEEEQQWPSNWFL